MKKGIENQHFDTKNDGLRCSLLGLRRWGLVLLSAGATSLIGWPMLSPQGTQPALALQYADGIVAFSAPPRLDNAYTTRRNVGARWPTYYLTFHLPATAQAPLSRITVEISEGRRDPIFRYRLEATEAFVGTPEQRGELVPLGDLDQDRESKTVTVTFVPAIAPGQTVTVALKPERNPRFSGTYLLGVTGYPAGETVEPAFMGYARLGFYDTDGGSPIFR